MQGGGCWRKTFKTSIEVYLFLLWKFIHFYNFDPHLDLNFRFEGLAIRKKPQKLKFGKSKLFREKGTGIYIELEAGTI